MKTIEENLHVDIGAWYRTYGITSLGILEGRGGQEERYREVGRGLRGDGRRRMGRGGRTERREEGSDRERERGGGERESR